MLFIDSVAILCGLTDGSLPLRKKGITCSLNDRPTLDIQRSSKAKSYHKPTEALMLKLIALYRKPKDISAFDHHYFNSHLPLVRKLPGLKRLEVATITGAPIGEAKYHVMAAASAVEMLLRDQFACWDCIRKYRKPSPRSRNPKNCFPRR